MSDEECQVMQSISLPKPLAQTSWESHAIFRETWLCVRLAPAVAEMFRIAGRSLYFEALQGDVAAKNEGDLRVALRAVARDLRQQQGLLSSLGKSTDLNLQRDFRVSLARNTAESLGRLAAALEFASR